MPVLQQLQNCSEGSNVSPVSIDRNRVHLGQNPISQPVFEKSIPGQIMKFARKGNAD
jgi:hypothetical protein